MKHDGRQESLIANFPMRQLAVFGGFLFGVRGAIFGLLAGYLRSLIFPIWDLSALSNPTQPPRAALRDERQQHQPPLPVPCASALGLGYRTGSPMARGDSRYAARQRHPEGQPAARAVPRPSSCCVDTHPSRHRRWAGGKPKVGGRQDPEGVDSALFTYTLFTYACVPHAASS